MGNQMNHQPIIIAPSILAADFSRLKEEIASIDKAGADWIHFDVMDGHFVPNITFGAGVVKAVRSVSDKFFDVHLMINNPDKYIADFISAGADQITIHAEACEDNLEAVLATIKESGARAGVALKPKTPIENIAHVLDKIDMILIMTVEPGFGGQDFIEAMLPKITAARTMIGTRNIDLEVDGGIADKTAPDAVKAGANILVAGSAIFNNDDYANAIESLRKVSEAEVK